MDIRAKEVTSLSMGNAVMQSPLWALLKGQHHWQAHAFTIDTGGQVSDLLVLTRPLAGRWTLAYIPHGPAAEHSMDLSLLAGGLASHLGRDVFALRIDLPPKSVNTLPSPPFIPCRSSIQPEATVRIDLSGGYEAVRTHYRSRAKRALKANAAASLVIDQECSFDDFYALYSETGKREGFLVRSKEYMRSIVETEDGVHMLCAHLDGKLVAALVLLFTDYEALYLYGASARLEKISPSYSLQDRAIQIACEKGCAVYDLHGVGEAGTKSGHLASLELFKRSFGGERITRPTTADWPYRKGVWRLYRAAEWVRQRQVEIRREKRRSP